ncbi:MAG: DHH family phosphoesterase [Spirochaetales bacterium]|jgi:nanoRNase/pAp phosphatase (c-di-AMP/oligoRNAs hydrolase)|nr:DHH family phosphoesterase [Spirochaetales bacterium]
MSETRLDILARLLKDAPDEVFLQPHNVPDPDAIASCLGLQHLLAQRGVESKIVYDQEIEKANSLRMLELFDVPMVAARDAHTLGEEDWAVLVDAQKGNANITDLPTDEVAVIDHHEYKGNQGYRFEDVRPEAGSCSAIIAEYFFENSLTPPSRIATSLLYGIFMDTDNLTRGTSTLDIDMFYQLYALADIALIAELRGNEISLTDLKLYADAFKTVEVYDEIGFLRLSSVNDSLLGAASDIVLSIAGINIVVAYAIREAGVKLSVRSINSHARANDLVRRLVDGVGVGGGHDHMAGGFIPAQKIDISRKVDTFLKHRAISFFEKTTA